MGPGNANHSNTLPDLKEEEKSEGEQGPPQNLRVPSTARVRSAS